MKTRSIKTKSKRVEKLVANRIKEAFSFIDDDIRITVGSENGADIKLSARAKARFPFSVEVKARASFETLYKFYEQAKSHEPKLIPIVVLKGDYKEPLVLLNFDNFLTLVNKEK